jgi:tetratricopeptide (TPR) repeat protein
VAAPAGPRISLCLIARDEAEPLPRCLASVRGAVDEIVLVDTGSRDRTPEIAREHGARVASFAWCDDFAAARNASLALATGDWVLVLDADEELPEATRGALPSAVAGARAQGLQVRMRNLAPPGEPFAWEEDLLTRLFVRADAHRYEGAIHEQVTPSIVRAGGRVAPSDLVVLHHGYARATAQGGASRARRNLAALERALRERPDDAYLWFQLGSTRKALGANADAAEALQRALALDREHRQLGRGALATCYAKLAQLALAAGDDRRAAQLAESCLRVETEHALALQILGVARAGTGDAAGALQAFRALLARPNLADGARAEVVRLVAVLGGGRA